MEIGRRVVLGQATEQTECICGGQIRKGDGKPWGDVEDDEACLACASRWHMPVRESGADIQPSIDSVEIAHGPDSHEWASDRRGVLIRKGEHGPRVRPVLVFARSGVRMARPMIYTSLVR